MICLSKYRTYSLFSCVGVGMGVELRMSNVKWIGLTITFCNQKTQKNDKREPRTDGN
jgi:hypothetical protein